MGNVVPLLVWLPFVVGAVLSAARGDDPWTWPVGLLAVGTVLGWLVTNQFGPWQNASMREELHRILEHRHLDLPATVDFVGCATPRYQGLADAHEHVGFLVLKPDELQVIAETETFRVPRDQVREIRFRPNVHSWMGLGRWISVEGEGFRLNIEPRNRTTLWQNRRESSALLERLEAWRRG
jgi:hypothetical protein